MIVFLGIMINVEKDMVIMIMMIMAKEDTDAEGQNASIDGMIDGMIRTTLLEQS